MIAEIAAGLSSLNAAKQIVQGLNAANTAINVNDVKIELQGLILEAQQALFAAQQAEASTAQKIGALEQEIVRLKDWSAEKASYQMTAICRGAFAYTRKPGMEAGEPPHWLCTTCFENGKKAVLQFQGQQREPNGGRGSYSDWRCNGCKATVTVQYTRKPDIPYVPGR